MSSANTFNLVESKQFSSAYCINSLKQAWERWRNKLDIIRTKFDLSGQLF